MKNTGNRNPVLAKVWEVSLLRTLLVGLLVDTTFLVDILAKVSRMFKCVFFDSEIAIYFQKINIHF